MSTVLDMDEYLSKKKSKINELMANLFAEHYAEILKQIREIHSNGESVSHIELPTPDISLFGFRIKFVNKHGKAAAIKKEKEII